MLQSEAGYIDARPHRQDRGNLLHRTAGPYIRVINRSTRPEAFSSAFPGSGLCRPALPMSIPRRPERRLGLGEAIGPPAVRAVLRRSRIALDQAGTQVNLCAAP